MSNEKMSKEKFETKWCKKTLIVTHHDTVGKVSEHCIYSGNLNEEQLDEKFRDVVVKMRRAARERIEGGGLKGAWDWSWSGSCEAECKVLNPFACVC